MTEPKLMSDDRLREIRERREAAPAGLWAWRGYLDSNDIFLTSMTPGRGWNN